MHLYVITRGIKHEVDKWVTHMQAQYLPYKAHGKEYLAQLGLRPVQLWEIVIPKDSMPILCKSLWGKNPTPRAEWKYSFQLGAMRKVLGAKKIPKFDEKLPILPIYRENVAIYPIGIKEDNHEADGTEIL